MDSNALGNELKRKLKKAASTASVIRIVDSSSITTPTPRPTPSPSIPKPSAAIQQQQPAQAEIPVIVSPAKPLVPKVFLEEATAALPPSTAAAATQEEEDLIEDSKKKSPGKPISPAATTEDDWDSGDDQTTSPINKILLPIEAVQPFTCVIQQLRGFFPLLPNRAGLDLELCNGIALCRKIAGLFPPPTNEQVLSEITEDYPPALAVVSEWKNVRLFVRFLFQKFPQLAVRFPYGEEHIVGDLLNQTNTPRFFSLLLAFAKECQYAPSTTPAQLTTADFVMLQSHDLEKWQQALKLYQENTFDSARLTHPIYRFLKANGALEEYFVPLIDSGYDTLERLSLLQREDCERFMMKPGHMKQLLYGCKQLAMTTSQSTAERLFEFHVSNPLSDDFWLSEERAKLAQLKQTKVRANNSTYPAFRDALQCTDYLLSLTSVPSVNTTVVLDFSSSNALQIGFAGSISPIAELELKREGTRFEIFEDGITRALSRLGKGQIKRMFIAGVGINAAVLEFALKMCPKGGVFLCGPKSTSCLALRVFGLMDGVCVDYDPLASLAKVYAVRQGQVLPQATVMSTVEPGEDLSRIVESCLLEGMAKPGSRVKGGLVIMGGGKRTVSKQVADRFSCGLFHLNFAATRWACASQIAIHPNFQHRWVTLATQSTGLDDSLFPLVSFEHRKSLVSKSICALHVLHRMVVEEEHAKDDNEEEDKQPTKPAIMPPVKMTPMSSKVAAAVAAVEAKQPSPVAPGIRPIQAPTTLTNRVVITKTSQTTDKFERMAELFKKLQGLLPKAAFLDAKAFILQDVASSSQPTQSLLNLTLKDVIARLPQDIKSKLSPDLIIMDEDE